MKKLKKWLYERFLPAWCRDDLIKANELLSAKVQEQAREIERLEAYIDGLCTAQRRQPRIVINCKEVSKQ